MDSKKDGGLVFPRPVIIQGKETEWGCPGISLRDYFAAKAMLGLLAQKTNEDMHDFAQECSIAEGIADASYIIADAMLKEREK